MWKILFEKFFEVLFSFALFKGIPLVTLIPTSHQGLLVKNGKNDVDWTIRFKSLRCINAKLSTIDFINCRISNFLQTRNFQFTTVLLVSLLNVIEHICESKFLWKLHMMMTRMSQIHQWPIWHWYQDLLVLIFHSFVYFSPMFHFYTPTNCRKYKYFLTFSGGMERECWV